MTDFWSSPLPSTFANEADVEHQLVLPLLEKLGYEKADIVPKYPVEFREGRRGRKPEPDFVCFNGMPHDRNSSLLVVEVKGPGEPLTDGKEQGESYAFNLRAPVLLLTNGQRLQAWQLQPTRESDRVIDIEVADLVVHRGTIESLLSKKALVTLCERLAVKQFVKSALQHKEYVAAEYARITKDQLAVHRTLRAGGGNEKKLLTSDQLITAQPAGAIILAPSGFGKSTLSHQILEQALRKCSNDEQAPLPFLISLPAMEPDTGSLLRFMQERLAAYSPGETVDTLREMLRTSGAIIICDAFDRVSAPLRNKIQSELSLAIRDFPLAQLFVLSRESVRPELPLPQLNLTPPSDEELRKLESMTLGHSLPATFVVSMMPKALRNICENILVARLVLEYWQAHRQYPVELQLLFRAWLDNILHSANGTRSEIVWQESALTLLAGITVDAPIEVTKAAAALKDKHLEPSLINDLIERGALRINGASVELQHEVLADYLRTRQLASEPEMDLQEKLSGLVISTDSLFPTLLMSQLRSRKLQSVLWKRLSEANIEVYLEALRYRFNLSEEMAGQDQAGLSQGYLEDLLDGIEEPLNMFFPTMRKSTLQYLTQQEAGALGIVGVVQGPPINGVTYALRGIKDGNRVAVGQPQFQQNLNAISWIHLERSGYRLDSGRLVGASVLRDTILALIENQEVEGGIAWISERLVGRVRHLQRSYQIPISETDTLEALQRTLLPYAGRRVPYGNRERYWLSIDSILHDISALQAAGMERLDLWWEACGWLVGTTPQSNDVIEKVLAELYRRQQIAMANVVEHTFPRLAKQLASYTTLPARWNIAVVTHFQTVMSLQIHASWRPVTSWEDAGADVIFADSPPPWGGDNELRDALEKLGRPASRYTVTSSGPMPSLEGYWLDGRFPGTTPVVRGVCSILKEDMKHLFSALPSHETIRRG